MIRIGMLKQDPATIWRKRRPRALRDFERQLLRTAAIAIHSPDLKHTSTVGVKHDVTIIRRDDGRVLPPACRCQRSCIATLCVDLEYVSDATRIGCIENLVIWSYREIVVTARAGTDRSRFRFIRTKQPESRESLCLNGDERTAVRAQTQFAIIAQIISDCALCSVAKEFPDLHERSAVSFRQHDDAAAVRKHCHTPDLVKFLRRKRNVSLGAVEQI